MAKSSGRKVCEHALAFYIEKVDILPNIIIDQLSKAIERISNFDFWAMRPLGQMTLWSKLMVNSRFENMRPNVAMANDAVVNRHAAAARPLLLF